MQQKKKKEMIYPLVVSFRAAWQLILQENVAGLFQNTPAMVLGVINVNERQFRYILEALMEKKSSNVVPQRGFVFDFTKTVHHISGEYNREFLWFLLPHACRFLLIGHFNNKKKNPLYLQSIQLSIFHHCKCSTQDQLGAGAYLIPLRVKAYTFTKLSSFNLLTVPSICFVTSQ